MVSKFKIQKYLFQLKTLWSYIIEAAPVSYISTCVGAVSLLPLYNSLQWWDYLKLNYRKLNKIKLVLQLIMFVRLCVCVCVFVWVSGWVGDVCKMCELCCWCGVCVGVYKCVWFRASFSISWPKYFLFLRMLVFWATPLLLFYIYTEEGNICLDRS